MTNDFWDKLGGVIRSAGIIGKVSVNSCLNSLIWIIGLFCIVIIFSFFTEINDWRIVFIMLFLGATLACVLIAYKYFAKNDPDALRSESFNLEVRKYQIEMMGQKNKEVPLEAVIIGKAEKNKLKMIQKEKKTNAK